jgi:hypothetical protein
MLLRPPLRGLSFRRPVPCPHQAPAPAGTDLSTLNAVRRPRREPGPSRNTPRRPGLSPSTHAHACPMPSHTIHHATRHQLSHGERAFYRVAAGRFSFARRPACLQICAATSRQRGNQLQGRYSAILRAARAPPAHRPCAHLEYAQGVTSRHHAQAFGRALLLHDVRVRVCSGFAACPHVSRGHAWARLRRGFYGHCIGASLGLCSVAARHPCASPQVLRPSGIECLSPKPLPGLKLRQVSRASRSLGSCPAWALHWSNVSKVKPPAA